MSKNVLAFNLHEYQERGEHGHGGEADVDPEEVEGSTLDPLVYRHRLRLLLIEVSKWEALFRGIYLEHRENQTDVAHLRKCAIHEDGEELQSEILVLKHFLGGALTLLDVHCNERAWEEDDLANSSTQLSREA